MPRSLYAKLALALTAIFALLGLFVVLLMWQATEDYQQEVSQELNHSLAKSIVTEQLLFQDGAINQQALENIFHMLMVINPRIELYLLDPAGKIIAFSAPPGKVVRQSVSLAPVRQFINDDIQSPLLGDDPRGSDRQKIFSAAPITENGELRGYLYVILAGEQYDSIVQMLNSSYVFKLSLGMLLTGLVFALLSGLLLFALFTRRLRRLTQLVDAFKRSDFRGRLPAPTRADDGDEIHRLWSVFHAMSERISSQVSRLEHTDALRRELVVNVSHDLRTPLASLQGYLETLSLKGDTLTADDRRHYLDIAFKHSKRLGKLIDELFELAKLDANEIQPEVEPFSLAELVQDVAQKFELRAEQRGVAIRLAFADNMPFVLGDIALIERVLDNLLENALRHTPRDGSIEISLEPTGDLVTVRITDTGHGINARDLPHIFERFYQPANTRTENGGAGLGLAIAKRILELHGSAISASNAVNAGAAFAFHLPAS